LNYILIKNKDNFSKSGTVISIFFSISISLVLFLLHFFLVVCYHLLLSLMFNTTFIQFTSHLHHKFVIIVIEVFVHEILCIISLIHCLCIIHMQCCTGIKAHELMKG